MAAEGAKSVRTALGRIRWLPQGEEAEWPRFTALVNTPVQGGSADALKQAMVDLADKLPSSASIVSTVHDELIVECATDTAEEVKALVGRAMLDAVQTIFPGGCASRWKRAYAIVGLRSDWRHGTTRGNAQKKPPASRS